MLQIVSSLSSILPPKRKNFKCFSVPTALACGLMLIKRMNAVEKKYVLGIVTDEDAMFDILAKFLTKEGYEVRRVHKEISGEEDIALVIHAPTRSSDRSRLFLGSVKTKKLIIVQYGDEEFAETDESAVVLSERPLNLKQLGDTIKKTLAKAIHVEAVR
jgi:hypothetical protein